MDKEIEKIRADIDVLDKKLLGGLRERQVLVRALGALKKEQGGAAFRPAREVALMRRLLLGALVKSEGAEGESAGLPPVALTYIWRQIIALSLFSQSSYRFGFLVSERARTAESLASAKAYAGGAAPVKNFTKAKDFFDAMAGRTPMIGFIPCSETDWWRERTAEIFVVGRWNYIEDEQTEPLYILAKQLPETTEDDSTLVVKNDKLHIKKGFLTQGQLGEGESLLGAFANPIKIKQ